MSKTKGDKLRAAASRVVAIVEAYEIREKFRKDWTILDRHADAFDHAHARLRAAVEDFDEQS